jgi:hypothetical protein
VDHRPFLSALGAALLSIGAAPGALAKPPIPAVSEAEQQAIREASARGALLYAYDQAAWHGTDEMMAKLPDARSKVGGWIVDGPAEAPELVFFDRDTAAPHAVFIADFRDGKRVSSRVAEQGEPALSPERRRLVAARTAATEVLKAKGFQRCSAQPMNTVVLPPAAPGGPIYVYLLTPQPDMNTIPFGGHYRVAVAPDGSAGEIRPFTNSCIAMPSSPPAGATAAGLFITHLLDPVPTEIHVFSSLVAHVPVMVGTKDGRVWAVDGTRIAPVGKIAR